MQTSRTATALRSTLVLAAFGLSLFASQHSANATPADRTVCPAGCTDTSLQAAVEAAPDGGVIEVRSDVYEAVEIHDKKLVIRYDWQTRVTIDGGNANATLYVGPNAELTTWGLDITGSVQAGVWNEGTVKLRNTYLYGIESLYGAVLNFGFAVIRDNSLVSNNHSTSYYAGGVNNVGGVIQTWAGCATFMGNTGYNGGALSNHDGTVRLRGCSFTGNDAYLGGAIHNSFGDITVENSSFSTNHAASLGGAWSNHNIGGTVTVTGSGYAGNTTGTGQYEDCYDVNGSCTP